MTQFRNMVLLIITAAVVFSCTKEHEITIYNRDVKGISLSIDSVAVAIDSEKMFTTITLAGGVHTVQSNGLFPDTINVTDDALLSTGKTNMVQFPVKYGTDKTIGHLSVNSNGPILIGDSAVIYDEVKDQDALIQGLKLMVRVNAKGNRASKPTLHVIPGKRGLIKKTWHFDYENMPETISGDKSVTTEMFGKTRNALISYNGYFAMALLSDAIIYEKIEKPEVVSLTKEYFKLIKYNNPLQ